MKKHSTLLMFNLGTLSLAVDARQAHLVLDSYSSARFHLREDGENASHVLHNGNSIPCLDLSVILGEEDPLMEKHQFTLVLHHKGKYVGLRVSRVDADYAVCERQASAIPEHFTGLARLLLVEQLGTSWGRTLRLDVEMLVRVGNQRKRFLTSQSATKAPQS